MSRETEPTTRRGLLRLLALVPATSAAALPRRSLAVRMGDRMIQDGRDGRDGLCIQNSGDKLLPSPVGAADRLHAIKIPADYSRISTSEYKAGSGIGGIGYVRLQNAPANPADPRFKRTADRFRRDLTQDAANGGWWMLDPRAYDAIFFGARGEGSNASDDQAAFANLAAVMQASYENFNYNGGTVDFQSGAHLQPGFYDVPGMVFNINGSLLMRAAINGSVILRNAADQYALNYGNNRLVRTDIEGIVFVGGKGAFHHGNPGSNVGGQHRFGHCEFIGYTEAAIANEAQDQPYLKVHGSGFLAKGGSSAIGIAWGGNCDLVDIDNNRFLQNQYHIKLGARDHTTSGDWRFSRNDFISFGAIPLLADIWLVTNVAGSSDGRSGIIVSNKFGNENHIPGNPRILIAPEQATANLPRPQRRPVLTWDDTDGLGAWQGVIVTDNGFSGGGVETGGILRSYTGDLRGFTWRGNKNTGSPYAMAVEFMGAHAPRYTNQDWDVHVDPGYSGFTSGRFSNAPVGRIYDPGCVVPADPLSFSGVPVVDDAGFIELANLQNFASWGRGDDSTTITPYVDGYGRNSGAEYRATADGSNGAVISLPAMPPNRQAWVQFDLKPAAANSVAAVNVLISSYGGEGAVLLRSVPISLDKPRILLPFTTPAGGSNKWQFIIKPIGSVPHFSSFRVENGLVNVGREPGRIGHVQTRGLGLWNTAHIVMGSFHIWATSKGVLRIKNGDPTSENDGVVVGAQS